MQRFIQRHDLHAFQMNPHFPVMSLQIIRGAVAAEKDGYLENYIDKILVHMWEEPKKMDDLEVIKAAFEESGFDSNKLLEQMQDPEIKAQLISNTEAAVERGVFGIPTFFVGDEMFFGKDTLWQVEEKLGD
jgi:2-hydroxychromene-2-carboxylate isomerase